MAMVELPSSSSKNPPPSTSFSTFPSPPLQWARSKRLRSYPSPLRRFPAPSPQPTSPPPPPHTTTTKKPNSPDEQGSGSDKNKKNPTPTQPDTEAQRSLRSRDEYGRNRRRAPAEKKKKEKVELWISLSRDEIEEDYYSITGSKLPRRPKRRSRNNHHPNALDRVFPGAWLPNTVTVEMYKVHEPNEGRRVSVVASVRLVSVRVDCNLYLSD